MINKILFFQAFIYTFFGHCCFSAELPKGAPLSQSDWKKCEKFISKNSRHLSESVLHLPQSKDLPCSLSFDHATKSIYINLKAKRNGYIGRGCNKEVTRSILYGRKPILIARCEGGESVLKEEKILSQLKNTRGIVHMHSCIHRSKSRAELMLTYCNSGSLRHIEEGKVKVRDWELIPIAHDLIAGLRKLHSIGYIHRDLKRDNVLLHRTQGRLRALIADFGIALPIDESPSQRICIPNSTCPPEVLIHPYDKIDRRKSEVHSLGILLHCIFFKKLPAWSPIVQQSAMKLLTSEKREQQHQFITRAFINRRRYMHNNLKGMRRDLCDLIFRMIEPNPSHRISLDEAYETILKLEAKWRKR